MDLDPKRKNLLVAVGSRSDRVCSIGSFARAEAKALQSIFAEVKVLEPDAQDIYPMVTNIERPDYVLFHAPSLHDRKRPWNALLSAAKIRIAFPKAKFLVVVHEFSEAPLHWRFRQIALTKIADGVITNSEPDHKAVRSWHKRVLRTALGPTLFFDELLKEPSSETNTALLAKRRDEARHFIIKKFPNHFAVQNSKWILHPGLLTPGKGIEFFERLAPVVDSTSKLILMGGTGPKARDQEFAQAALEKLRQRFGSRFVFIDSPDDEIFRQMLMASDLVILPYDNGLSERRSSFLSAMCCGANVWTTIGPYSEALAIEGTGVHRFALEHWRSNDAAAIENIKAALGEGEQEVIERRMKNLLWASGHTWQVRAEALRNFISALR